MKTTPLFDFQAKAITEMRAELARRCVRSVLLREAQDVVPSASVSLVETTVGRIRVVAHLPWWAKALGKSLPRRRIESRLAEAIAQLGFSVAVEVVVL